MDELSLRIEKENNDRLLNRCRMQLISAKEKLKRVDPVSEEFESTADLIEKLRDEIKDKVFYDLQLRSAIHNLER